MPPGAGAQPPRRAQAAEPAALKLGARAGPRPRLRQRALGLLAGQASGALGPGRRAAASPQLGQRALVAAALAALLEPAARGAFWSRGAALAARPLSRLARAAARRLAGPKRGDPLEAPGGDLARARRAPELPAAGGSGSDRPAELARSAGARGGRLGRASARSAKARQGEALALSSPAARPAGGCQALAGRERLARRWLARPAPPSPRPKREAAEGGAARLSARQARPEPRRASSAPPRRGRPPARLAAVTSKRRLRGGARSGAAARGARWLGGELGGAPPPELALPRRGQAGCSKARWRAHLSRSRGCQQSQPRRGSWPRSEAQAQVSASTQASAAARHAWWE